MFFEVNLKLLGSKKLKTSITKIIQLSTLTAMSAFLPISDTKAEIVLMKACYHNDVFFTEVTRNSSCTVAHSYLPPHHVGYSHHNVLSLGNTSKNGIPGILVEDHLCVIKEKNTRYIED